MKSNLAKEAVLLVLLPVLDSWLELLYGMISGSQTFFLVLLHLLLALGELLHGTEDVSHVALKGTN